MSIMSIIIIIILIINEEEDGCGNNGFDKYDLRTYYNNIHQNHNHNSLYGICARLINN